MSWSWTEEIESDHKNLVYFVVYVKLQFLLQFNIFIIRQKIEILRWLFQKKLRAKSWEISADKGKVDS